MSRQLATQVGLPGSGDKGDRVVADEYELLASIGNGRRAAEEHMVDRLRQGQDRWNEQSVTDELCRAAYPALRYVPFNQRQEGVVGADWLWWWVDRTGECFGLLNQAKNLARHGAHWKIGFMQRNGGQMRDLLDTADLLQVPAAYLLYCGDTSYRDDLTCHLCHPQVHCTKRERAAVTLLTAPVAQYTTTMELTPDTVAAAAFHRSVPIEDVCDPAISKEPIFDFNWGLLGPDLREFLLDPQAGARGVARRIFAKVAALRLLQYKGVLAERIDVGEAIFPHLPSDTGHFGTPYFAHLLRGLKSRLPSYVESVLDGGPAPDWMPPTIRGMAILST